MTEYRIEFSIQGRGPDDDDFSEIGFGSSGSWDSVDQAAHIVNSMAQNWEWETTPGMPEPKSIDPGLIAEALDD